MKITSRSAVTGRTVMTRLAELFAVFGSKVSLWPETKVVLLPATLGVSSEKTRLRIIETELPEASDARLQVKPVQVTPGALEEATAEVLRAPLGTWWSPPKRTLVAASGPLLVSVTV